MLDIYTFIEISEEIDRKRAAIKRVMSTINSILWPTTNKPSRKLPEKINPVFLHCNHVLIEVTGDEVPNTSHALKRPEQKLCYFVSGDEWRTFRDDCPLNKVQMFFDSLPAIVEQLDLWYPTLGIKNHFESIIQLAKN